MRNRSSKPWKDSTIDKSSIIKILISTDNHLGYLERDPVRGEDSFRAFEEVLEIAKVNDVDMLLLAGDLFHDNKPSRSTVVKTMKLLRKTCMSPDGAVRLAVRSDPTDVNYMNPSVAVSLPVFVIHGNHDDPTGGVGSEALSAIDLLAETGLVTYFGKQPSTSKVDIAPILLQKGKTALALYGLGNIRDEVLYKTWATERKVRWLSPEQPSDPHDEQEDDEDALRWFNLFVLHQNRYTRGTAKAICETLLPPWLNYVVWGHEHDSIPDLTPTEPPVVQPGSTVATSLTDGESKLKHAIMLDVYDGRILRHEPVPLHTVRNFQFEELVLSEQKDLSDTDPEALAEFLKAMTDQMVLEQEALFDDKMSRLQNMTFKRAMNGFKYPPNVFYVSKLSRLVRQPLIRLRVEITGNWQPPNPQRFGQSSIGRVASAADMISYHRSKRQTRRRVFMQGEAGGQADHMPQYGQDGDDLALGGGDSSAEQMQIPLLVQYFLCHKKAGSSGLKFLALDELMGAVDKFVSKDEKMAIPEYVTKFMEAQQKRTLDESEKDGNGWNEEELLQKFVKRAQEAARKLILDNPVPSAKAPATAKPSARKGKPTSSATQREEQKPQPEEPEDNFEERMEHVHELLHGNPSVAAATAAYKAVMDGLEKEDDSDDEEVKPTPRKRKAATRGRGRGRGRGGSSTSRRGATQSTLSLKPPAAPKRERRSARQSEAVLIEESDEEVQVSVRKSQSNAKQEESEEEYVPAPTTRKRRARNSAAGSASRAASRARTESQSQQSSGRRSAFANRAVVRRQTSTINVDEESGDDAM